MSSSSSSRRRSGVFLLFLFLLRLGGCGAFSLTTPPSPGAASTSTSTSTSPGVGLSMPLIDVAAVFFKRNFGGKGERSPAEVKIPPAAPIPSVGLDGDVILGYPIAPPKSMEITINALLSPGDLSSSGGAPAVSSAPQLPLQEDVSQIGAEGFWRRRASLAQQQYFAEDPFDIAQATASSVRTKHDAHMFIKEVGLEMLTEGLRSADPAMVVLAASGLTCLVQSSKETAQVLASIDVLPLVLSRAIGKVGLFLRRTAGLQAAQCSILELICAMLLASDECVVALQKNAGLIRELRHVAALPQRVKWGRPLTLSQRLANKALAMLGVNEWFRRTPRQRGIRVLSLDGGGTRGVITIEMLKCIRDVTGMEPSECFDLIVGTSTGGIIAGLLGLEMRSVASVEELYDNLLADVFQKHPTGGMNLALKQAFYDENRWMGILKSMLGDKRMIDSAEDPNQPKVAFPSTVLTNPAKTFIWRNYGVPKASASRYEGSWRHMVRTAIRATTAAPTFFPPLNVDGVLYSDGALLANNPSALAFHEAKCLFGGQNLHIEALVSLGTGRFEAIPDADGTIPSEPVFGWDGLLNQLVASATETEKTAAVLDDLAPRAHLRFNPLIDIVPIDETRKDQLQHLKTTTRAYMQQPEVQAKLRDLVNTLT